MVVVFGYNLYIFSVLLRSFLVYLVYKCYQLVVILLFREKLSCLGKNGNKNSMCMFSTNETTIGLIPQNMCYLWLGKSLHVHPMKMESGLHSKIISLIKT